MIGRICKASPVPAYAGRRFDIGPLVLAVLLTGLASADTGPARAAQGKQQSKTEDPYAEYVWPPPPNEPRIKLERIISGRRDVEGGESKIKRFLIGASPPGTYDLLEKPTGVAIDEQGRILVTDWAKGALLRFDVENARMDVFGTTTRLRLTRPMGVDVAPDGTIFVADQELAKVIGFDPEGAIKTVVGGEGELENPVGVSVAPSGALLYVADAKRHSIVVFEIGSGKKIREIGGESGTKEGQFAFPTALDFDQDGNLLVVDQLNSRVQLLTAEGEFQDAFGALGTGFGSFVRPKDIAVDGNGLIYVTDFAFNNFQIFDIDFTLLTFIGSGGTQPGTFQGASGIDERDGRIAVVDQLGRRVQVFRFLDAGAGPAEE